MESPHPPFSKGDSPQPHSENGDGLQKQVADLQQRFDWVSITDRLPVLTGAYPVSDGDVIFDGYFDLRTRSWGIIEPYPKVHAVSGSDFVKFWFDVNILALPKGR